MGAYSKGAGTLAMLGGAGNVTLPSGVDLEIQGNFVVDGNFTFGDAATDNLTVNGDLIIADDKNLHFGTDEDGTIKYDETTDNRVEVTGAAWHFTPAVTLASTLTMEGKIILDASGGAASASGLLMGTGTSGSPATTATADAKFVEIRAETTATSGDNRLMYLRYSLNGTTGGECVRAFTKLEAAGTTVRGAHISLDVDSAGSASGLGVGVDSQLLVHNGALSGGTYAAQNVEIYSAGASTDVSGVTNISFLRCVAGGNATGIANVDDNAFFVDFSGVAAGSGNMIDTDITTHTAYGGLRVNIPSVGTRYIALVSA